jgi:hypothetical protein
LPAVPATEGSALTVVLGIDDNDFLLRASLWRAKA